MDFAILDVSKKLDLLRFPEGVDKPRILRYDPNQEPIMKVSVTADMPLTDLRWFGEEDLKKRLDSVPGLASVKVLGGLDEIIEVHLDEAALKRYGLSVETVSTRLREENINRTGGSLYENDARYLVRTLNEFRSLEEIGNTIISRTGDRKVYLREIAEVRNGHKDQDHISRINGKQGIELAFYKEGDANTVQVSRDLNHAIEKLQEQFADDYAITITWRGASFIEQAVNEVKSNAMLGGIIAILVLYFFLRDLRGTLIVGFAIPVSVMATFFAMLQTEVSMNIMSLGGLALGIGMLVDNSIVVLESIFVRRSRGDDAATAAAEGTGQVSGAVFASTLTTIVVFLPIVFITGIGGQLFRDLGLTVSFSLIASLVVSLTLMPTLYVMFTRRQKPVTTAEPAEKPTRMDTPYAHLLTLALRFRYAVLAAAIFAVFATFRLWTAMGVNLVPEMSQNDYYVLLEMDEGTPIEATDRATQWIEGQLLELDGVSVVFTGIGEFNQGVETRTGENLAQINFQVDGQSEPERVLANLPRTPGRRSGDEYPHRRTVLLLVPHTGRG